MDIIIIDGLSFALPLFIMAIGGIYCEKSGVTMLAVAEDKPNHQLSCGGKAGLYPG